MVEKHSKTFYLTSGKTFSNLKSFSKHLKEMSLDVYDSHVSEYKNDFSNWIRHSLKKEELSKLVDGQISKVEMELEVLRHLVHDLKKEKKKLVKKTKILPISKQGTKKVNNSKKQASIKSKK